MNEFQLLIRQHEKVYRIVSELKETLESTDKYKIMGEIKNFKNNLDELIDAYFSAEEDILFSILQEKEMFQASNLECLLLEHNELIKKKNIMDELLEKYEQKPADLTYESLLEITKNIADELYNRAYSEDSILFSFSGTVLSEEEKRMVAKELANVSCECCPKQK